MIAGEVIVAEDEKAGAGFFGGSYFINDTVDGTLSEFSAEDGWGGAEAAIMGTASCCLDGIIDEVVTGIE